MSDSILSQDEIDNLLNGGSNSSSESSATVIPASAEDNIKPYDPNTQRRVVRERLYSLEMINERFARQFRIGLFNILRRSPDVTAGNIKIQPYHEFARNLPVMTRLNLINMNPLRGTALFVFSPNLVFTAVDNLFGGDGRFPTKADGREFTPTEQRIIQRMLSMAREAYDYAWTTIYKIRTEFVRSELQVKFTNITSSPNDIVITTPFQVDIGSHSGELQICIPFSIIEPIRELLTNPPLENSQHENNQWRNSLATQMRDTELELVVKFAEISTRLSRIMNLKPDDVIPLDRPDQIGGFVNDVPVMTGKYGSANNQYAIQVDDLKNSTLLGLKKE
ncbi:flagellar motor switch protein FliM [Kosakonia sp. H02]|nr:flagellar motor switch protein FliM [Kosakonia sp. H02]